jgi:hypothetical protein
MTSNELRAISAGLFSVSILSLLIGLPGLTGATEAVAGMGALIIGCALVTGALAIYGALLALRVGDRSDWPGIVIVSLIYVGLLVGWLVTCLGDAPYSVLFRARALDPLASSSGVLPLLGLCSIYTLYFAGQLARHSANACPHPGVSFPETCGPGFVEEMRQGYRVAECSERDLRDALTRYGAGLAVTIAFLGATCRSLAAFESDAYNNMLRMAVGTLVLVISLACYDLRRIWAGQRRFLIASELLGLEKEMQDVSGRKADSGERSALWMFSLLPSRLRLDLQTRKSLAGLGVNNEAMGTATGFEKCAADQFEKVLGTANPGNPSKGFLAQQLSRYASHSIGGTLKLLWTISFCFLMLVLVLNSYPAQGPILLGRAVLVLFLGVSFVVVGVLVDMERDATLSRITGSEPGQLGWGFWVRLFTLGSLPFLSVVAGLVPGVSTFISSWLAPGLEKVLR